MKEIKVNMAAAALSEAKKTYAAWERAQARARKAQQAREAARMAVLASCPHPPEYRREYKWEHDNGYGRQHMQTGEQCKICLACCAFPGPHQIWHLEEYHRKPIV